MLSGPLFQKYKSLSCKLCLMKKYYIIKHFNDPSLKNKKLDLTNKCMGLEIFSLWASFPWPQSMTVGDRFFLC